MPVTITVEISDELAQRMEAAIIRTGMERDDCLRDLIEYGIEDIEDCVEAVEISKKMDAAEDYDAPERIERAREKFGHITSNTKTLLSFLDVYEDRDLVSYSSVEEMDCELMREIEEEDRAHSNYVV